MKQRFTAEQTAKKRAMSPFERVENIETIKADLRRSDFAMPTATSPREVSSADQMQELLERLSNDLPFGYIQGMNYIVISLFRVTNSLEMTYALAFKLLSNERLTSLFQDETAHAINEACVKLNVFIAAYLPKLACAMERVCVETDFFAQTWLVTLLFHFQISETLSKRQRKWITIESQRVIESLVLDCLCLDSAKSLIKVPLCALAQLDLLPTALEHSMNFRQVRQKSRHGHASYQSNM